MELIQYWRNLCQGKLLTPHNIDKERLETGVLFMHVIS